MDRTVADQNTSDASSCCRFNLSWILPEDRVIADHSLRNSIFFQWFETVFGMKAGENRLGDDMVAVANPMVNEGTRTPRGSPISRTRLEGASDVVVMETQLSLMRRAAARPQVNRS